ncbi:hypothetical protein [Paraburkholderia sp. DGU8]|uniref:hypothetical protein n=1 Tax=Paraburkholderia sp. DGU8 TaxID=3161997 RepID=UPI00346787C4
MKRVTAQSSFAAEGMAFVAFAALSEYFVATYRDADRHRRIHGRNLYYYLILTVLGTAIAASVLSPLTRPDPSRSFAFGSDAYLIVTKVIAIFIESYFAGRCAPVLGWLHALLAGSVMIIAMACGATSFVDMPQAP